MTQFYDARGNIYGVVSPQALRAQGVDLPLDAEAAAMRRLDWASQAISVSCTWPEGQQPAGTKEYRSDGLLIGPFQHTAPFDLLIVNTDGTLAERSGNGLTIFAQSLADRGLVPHQTTFTMRVHHDKHHSPTAVMVERANYDDIAGFWLDLGKPEFGPHAVDANASNIDAAELNGRVVSSVKRLKQIDGKWAHSVFIRIGNPHCVTLVSDRQALPGFDSLNREPLNNALRKIAFAEGEFGVGEPCAAGINLQWAYVVNEGLIEARIFERGEGPTASSGTSASAVACAAWMAGWVNAGHVRVIMPGGTAPVRLVERDGILQQVFLFGTTYQIGSV